MPRRRCFCFVHFYMHADRANARSMADNDGDAPIPIELNTALVEALCYAGLLDDEAVARRLGDALLALCTMYEMALDDGSRYPGLYRLLASPSPELWALVGDVKSLQDVRVAWVQALTRHDWLQYCHLTACLTL